MRSVVRAGLALTLSLVVVNLAPAQFAGVLSAVGRAGTTAGRAGAVVGRSHGALHVVPHGSVSPGDDDSDWTGWLIGTAVVVVLFGVILAGAWANDREIAAAAPPVSSVHVRVTGTPPGEAPEAVRRAWVGLVLPVHPAAPAPRSVVGDGVLTGEAANLTHGYFVDARLAVATLDLLRPDAAAWWRASAPHLFVPGSCLVFPAEVCEVA